MKTSDSFLILGQGYVGNFLRNFLAHSGFNIYGTHRNQPIEFRLEDRSTWKNIPTCENCFWLFDPTSELLAREFLSQHRRQLGRLTVLGTTSVYKASTDSTITEISMVDPVRQRAAVEKDILAMDGQVVRASGIYGPARNPVHWLKNGRIAQLEKWINLIHIEDLIQILLLAQNLEQRSQVFIASNGQPIVWRQIAEAFKTIPNVNEALHKNDKMNNTEIAGKIINNEWSLSTLQCTIIHNDVLLSLKQLNESEKL